MFTSDGWRPFGNFARLKAWVDAAIGEEGAPIENWRLHDFRRTLVSTLAAKPFRFDPITLDLLLGHQPSQLSPVARIYQKEKHLDARRAALEAWAKHLTMPSAEVVTLRPPHGRSRRARKLDGQGGSGETLARVSLLSRAACVRLVICDLARKNIVVPKNVIIS